MQKTRLVRWTHSPLQHSRESVPMAVWIGRTQALSRSHKCAEFCGRLTVRQCGRTVFVLLWEKRRHSLDESRITRAFSSWPSGRLCLSRFDASVRCPDLRLSPSTAGGEVVCAQPPSCWIVSDTPTASRLGTHRIVQRERCLREVDEGFQIRIFLAIMDVQCTASSCRPPGCWVYNIRRPLTRPRLAAFDVSQPNCKTCKLDHRNVDVAHHDCSPKENPGLLGTRRDRGDVFWRLMRSTFLRRTKKRLGKSLSNATIAKSREWKIMSQQSQTPEIEPGGRRKRKR